MISREKRTRLPNVTSGLGLFDSSWVFLGSRIMGDIRANELSSVSKQRREEETKRVAKEETRMLRSLATAAKKKADYAF